MDEKEYIEREAVNALIKAECSPKVVAYLIDAVDTIPAPMCGLCVTDGGKKLTNSHTLESTFIQSSVLFAAEREDRRGTTAPTVELI